MNDPRTPEPVLPMDARGLSRAAMHGMSWTAVSVGATKVASFVAQFALGWLLSPDDFGLYAMAISSTAMVQGWTDGGAAKLLVQRGSEYHKLVIPVCRWLLLVNSVAVILLLAGAPLASHLFNAPGLTSIIVFIALSIALGTPAVIFRAELTANLQFKTISKVVIVSAVIRNLSVVVFAFLGFGALSFVLPLCLAAIYETVAFARQIKVWPWQEIPTNIRISDIWKNAGWIMITSLGTILLFRGQYFVIGLLEPRSVLGIYFFGSQISSSFVQLLLPGMGPVMLGTFSRAGNQQLQARGYLKSIRMLSLFIVPATAVMILTANASITLLWSGKWDAAIPVVQIILASLPAQVLILLSQSLMEAQGRWRLRAILAYERVVTSMVFAGLGAWMGGLILIALCSSSTRLFFSYLQCIATGRIIHLKSSEILLAMGPLAIVGAICAIISHYAVLLFLPAEHLLVQAIVTILLFFLSYGLLTWSLLGAHYREAFSMFMLMKARRSQAKI